MAIKKKVIKSPAVRVETRKLSTHDVCCDKSFYHNIKSLLILLLLLINTVLIVFVMVRQVTIQAQVVGGMENYKMVKEIYKTDMFKQQQTQQIQDALQMYKGGMMDYQEMPIVTPENGEAMIEEMIIE